MRWAESGKHNYSNSCSRARAARPSEIYKMPPRRVSSSSHQQPASPRKPFKAKTESYSFVNTYHSHSLSFLLINMKTTTLFALVAAATMGYASPGGESDAAAEYGTEETAPSYGGTGSTSSGSDDGSGSYSWGWKTDSSGSGSVSVSGWPVQRSGRFGGNKWGEDDGDDDGSDFYGSCPKCQVPPPGYAIPPPRIKWPTDLKKLPPGPIKDNFDAYGQACSSTNNVNDGNSGNSVGCCNKVSSGGSTSGGGGLFGGLLNGLLGGDTTCTLDILSSTCSSSSSIACCPTTDSGNGFSLINLQANCVPINL
ncbi:hypothetical protein DOTSEDRAFT_91219 [Dothistroma septosporum NZE10]|uniref:Hydrophobin n=1 Tax=Dothistroma septosporum (strain NZE10 / CBS 128990) TaxID=675120 RepID=N1PEZ3_DOTSN|nr:hypothetical protein DOTSEDRAFT_91219 [Dothistroma septosporum NZE10]